MLSKEEVLRTDKIHRRADEAVEQDRAGHILTELVALREDESADGQEVRWTMQDVKLWPERKRMLIANTLINRKTIGIGGAIVIQGPTRTDATGAPLRLDAMDPPYQERRRMGLIMFRESEAYRAVHPAPDPYTKGDKQGDAERG